MFAVIRTGGKQYKVAVGDVVFVEKLAGDKGAKIKLEDVLMVVDGGKTTIGTPTIKGAAVTAEVLGQDMTDKVIVFKKQRRKNHRRKKGHRQHITVLKVTDIKAA
jgi:large subunit ribosomal protein L21